LLRSGGGASQPNVVPADKQWTLSSSSGARIQLSTVHPGTGALAVDGSLTVEPGTLLTLEGSGSPTTALVVRDGGAATIGAGSIVKVGGRPPAARRSGSATAR
jgi:hypothetical protein